MTIRFVKYWNGYSPDAIIHNLGSTEEARLVSLGYATTDLDGPGTPEGELARITTSPSGGVAIAGATDSITSLGQYPGPRGIEILPTNDITRWNTDKTAALTVEVDSTVLFDGRPTLKITIPAGTSGTCKVGTNIADALIPYGWDKSDFVLAVMHSGFTGYDWATTFPPVPLAYFGNATYADFWTTGGALSNFPETKPRAGEWFVVKPPISDWGVGSGSPDTNLMAGGVINQTALRCKLQWTQVSQATDCVIRIGVFGKMPARKKATLVWSLDDGYKSWYDFIMPLFKHYDMPISMGITTDLTGTANYLTAAQIQEMHNDPSRLFDFVNHSTVHVGYDTIGAATAYARAAAARDALRSLGITGDGPLHFPTPQSQFGNDLIDLLSAGGFLTSRHSPLTAYQHGRDQMMRSGQDKLRWYLGCRAFLGSATSLATVQTAVDTAITNKEAFMIGGHDFAGTASTYVWTKSDMVQLVGYVASKVAAGTLEVKSWSRWYADLTGRNCTRR